MSKKPKTQMRLPDWEVIPPGPPFPSHPLVRPVKRFPPVWVGLRTPEQAVPLIGVAIEVQLTGLATRTTVHQRYRNTEKVPIEAVYCFPLEEGAAVCGFSARIGERLVRGVVEEREKAFEVYDDAMAAGKSAFLLDQERPNVFTASVGNVAPGEGVELTLSYVALARFEGDALRLTLPTTVAPRYVPPGPPELGQPDGERVNPEKWGRVPYGLSIRVEIDAARPILQIESPSHPVRLRFDGPRAAAELAQQEAALDRDFVLLVELERSHEPVARVARETDGTAVVMVELHPDLPASGLGSEVLFLLDCSGSMEGESIDQAKRALELAIRALGEGDSFNVVRFGSSFESLWSHPQGFGEATLEQATGWVRAIRADLGGTEILRPLRQILELPRDTERTRQVLLLTDGQVSNEKEICNLAARHPATRIFTFGIGTAASELLVRELARVSRGAAELIYPGERIEAKVLRMFHRLRTPSLADLGLDWGGLVVEQAPAQLPPVFGGESFVVFGRVRSGAAATITLAGGGHTWALPLDLIEATEGGALPVLWARERIRDLERGVPSRRGSAQRREAPGFPARELLELSRRYGLVSSVASYVAVDEREGKRIQAPAELRRVPVALAHGWGGGAAKAYATLGPSSDFLVAGGPPGGIPLETAPKGRLGSVSAECVPEGHASFEDVVWDSSSEPTPAGSNRLYEVLLTQRADGSFRLSPVLRKWLAFSLTAVELAAARDGEDVVATAVVLALLERDEAGRRDEWRPAAEKATRWLAGRGVKLDGAALLAPARP